MSTYVQNLVGKFTDLDWKRLLKLKQDEVLGLDIGSSAVKMVHLRKDDAGYTVTAAGIVDIADSDDNGNRTETNTIKAIRKCLQSTGTRTPLVVCGVSGPEVAIRDFKFPSLPPDEVEGAVSLEAEQICPFNINQASVHYQLIPDGEDGVRGILVAATNKVIKNKVQPVKSAALNCVLMDVDGLALLNCFSGLPFCEKPQNEVAKESEHEKPEAGRTTTAILNVGSSYTNLTIIGDNDLPFVRDMTNAGKTIVKEIATEKGASVETISRVLSDCENPGRVQSEIGDSLAKACRKLIVDVTETLRYYMAQEKSTTVDKIFVCGGFALVNGFVELLDSQLPARVVLWNPFDKIRCDAGRQCKDMLAKTGPAMAVAAGLAMRSI